MSSEETVTFNLELNARQPASELARINDLLTTYVALADQLGLPRNYIAMIRALERLRITSESTYRSIMLLYTATGPWGWALGLGGLGVSGLMLADQMEMRRPRY